MSVPKPKLLLKLLVTVLLLIAAISLVDRESLVQAAQHVVPGWLVLAFFLTLTMTLLDAVQFAGVVRSLDAALTISTSLKLTLIGRFFSIFTPAMVGSDVYRAVAMVDRGNAPLAAISFVAIARILSLISLVPVLLLGIPLLIYFAGSLRSVSGYIVVDIAVLIVTVALLFGRRVRNGATLDWATRFKPVKKVLRGTEQLRFVALKSDYAARVWLVAVLQHVLRVIVLWAVARAFTVDVPVLAYFAFVPVSLLIAMVPISLGAWGVREVSLIYALGLVGVPAESAFLTSVTFGLIGLPLALLGGLLWLAEGAPTPKPRFGNVAAHEDETAS